MQTIPKSIGRYQITDVLGRGAMGVVYRAVDPSIQRVVAIKTINKWILVSSEGEERFGREAQAAGRLNHPNVVAVFDFGYSEKQDSSYIVMEYVEGRDLKSYLDQGTRFTLKEAVGIMNQVLDALAYCHSRGVIHRD